MSDNKLNNIYPGGSGDGFAGIIIRNPNLVKGKAVASSLTGQWQQEDILINWKTEDGNPSWLYELERSTDNGNRFVKIATIHPSARIYPSGYTYTDKDIRSASVFYYRLKMITDRAGTSYSAIVRLDKKGKAVTYIVYPNPGKGLFNIGINGAKDISNYRYRIVTVSGQLNAR